MENNVRELRKKLGKTQAELAHELGVTTTAVSHWEANRATPTKSNLSKLAALAADNLSAPPKLTAFRPIQYLGSKRRLATQIIEAIDSVSPTSSKVGDLFCGSGAITSLLRRSRKVSAVDVQQYSQCIATALLNGKTTHVNDLQRATFWEAFRKTQKELLSSFSELVKIDDDARSAAERGDATKLGQLIEFGSIASFHQLPRSDIPNYIRRALEKCSQRAPESRSSLVATYVFGGVYFSVRQAIDIDSLHAGIKASAREARSVGFAILLSVISELVNTVGKQFAQPMRIHNRVGETKPLLLTRALKDRSLSAVDQWLEWSDKWREELKVISKKGTAICSDVLDFLATDQECEVYYADPPYTIDHYSRFYHVLETLTLRDVPPLDTMQKSGNAAIMRGLYRKGRYQSPFSIPSTVQQAFQRLFSFPASRGCSLVLSYSPFNLEEGHRPRLLNFQEIRSLARKYYRRVEIVELSPHAHRKLNAKKNNVHAPSSAEMLIMCEQ